MSKKKKIPVKKNEFYTAVVEDLSHEGMGVVRVESYTLFVEGALPGEKIELKVVKTGKKFGFGKLTEILEVSPHRVALEDEEDIYRQTGTMPLQHMTYETQLKFKQNQVDQNFKRIGHLEDVPVFETLGMDNPYGYRNKAQIPVREIDGKITTGFYRKRSHDLIPMEDFQIQDPEIDRALIVVRDILREFDAEAYNETEHSGNIRHIIIRRGYYTEELMIVLVTRLDEIEHSEEITERIVEELPETVSIMQNINPEKTNVILGKESQVLFGDDKYHDRIFDYLFEISHQSFYQINPTQTEKLYQTALDFADLSGNEVVVDAYSGIGTLSIVLAEKARQVYGVEIVEPAVDNARRNAQLNAVDNVEFVVGQAEKILPQWAQEGRQVDAIVVDPPRKGLDRDFIDAALEIGPETFIYVSCNPSTLARDLKIFNESGYDVIKSQPVDMFPQTTHIESVTKLVKR